MKPFKNEQSFNNTIIKVTEHKLDELLEDDVEEVIVKEVSEKNGKIIFIAKLGRFKREKYELNISISKTD